MSRIDELRLITKIARLYHEQGLRQTDIVDRLGLSQSTVSRLLKRAREENIVRVAVVVPRGVYAELEEQLEKAYRLKEVLVVDADSDAESDPRVLRDIGSAAAAHLESILQPGEVIGVSSRSRALLAMVQSMTPSSKATGARVVQTLGSIGDPADEAHAGALTREFAALIRAEANFLSTPGIVRSAESRRYFESDGYSQATIALFPQLTTAFVGIGAIVPVENPSISPSVLSEAEVAELRAKGAVGNICFRFFDADGRPVKTALDESVVGVDLDQLRRVNRSIAIVGGLSKVIAIRGALKGGFVNTLITDRVTAESLLDEATPKSAREAR